MLQLIRFPRACSNVSDFQGRSQILCHVENKMENVWPSFFNFQIPNNKGADQTARMCRLICAFVVHKQQSQGFSDRGLLDAETQASWPPPGYPPDFVNLLTAKLYQYHKRCKPFSDFYQRRSELIVKM